MVGGNGIVSGGFGLGIGGSICMINQRKHNVPVSFFPDGPANQPNFHQPLNFPSILHLPLLFISQNNQFPQPTTHHYPTPSQTIPHPPPPYNIPPLPLHPIHLIQLYKPTQHPVQPPKKPQPPTLIQSHTYRKYPHFQPHHQKLK
ncbi:thiamine pyrophosphate-dependent enzyme, partial [Staphylococcus epidermidis]|uniref:thiamine pyrophosphate-dependent enzyme n=1 Tax=Staphylococcus epidermidis TaxID=1282 RepID=UPI0037D9DDBF